MNALHTESERRASIRTVADLLTSRLRPVRIVVGQNDGTHYEIVGVKLVHWMRRYQSQGVTAKDYSCGQSHYVIDGCGDFLQAVVSLEAV
jgi:hypothetical protein